MKELYDCWFTLKDTPENIENLLFNKDIFVISIKSFEKTFPMFYEVCYPTTEKVLKEQKVLSLNNFKQLSSTFNHGKFVIHCKIKKDIKTKNIFTCLDSPLNTYDYDFILKYIKDEV